MSNSTLAKLGVMALIALNLGAYYFLWPGSPWNQRAENGLQALSATSLEKGENPGKPAQVTATAGAAQPTQLGKPAAVQGAPLMMQPADPVPPDPKPVDSKTDRQPKASQAEKEPFAITLPPIPDPNDPQPATNNRDTGKAEIVVAKVEDPTIEQLKRLKSSFGKETAKPAAGNPAEPPPLLPVDSVNLKQVPQENITAKAESSPWTLQMEIAGGQKVLTARQGKQIEFRILCDHVEMKTTEGAVVAVGHVVVTGPGLKGVCNRFILRLASDSVTLDGKAEVQIQQGNVVEPAGQVVVLKGEQLTLRLQQAAPVTPASATSVGPPQPTMPNPFTPAPPFGVDKK